MDVNDVAQHREQMFLDAANHLAVDEGVAGRIAHLQLHAPGLSAQVNLEVLVRLEDRARIVGFIAAN